MLIFTTNLVCSQRDGVLNDCVKLEVSHSLLAWRVGVGGNGFFVLSVGGGVRERGRCCDDIFSCLLLFLGFAVVWRNGRREQHQRRSACCRRALKRAARAQRDLCGKN